MPLRGKQPGGRLFPAKRAMVIQQLITTDTDQIRLILIHKSGHFLDVLYLPNNLYWRVAHEGKLWNYSWVHSLDVLSCHQRESILLQENGCSVEEFSVD